MSEAARPLDLTAFAVDLDRLVDLARSGQSLAGTAPALLDNVGASTAVEPTVHHESATAWEGICEEEDQGERLIVCERTGGSEETLLMGLWSARRLTLWSLRVGESFFAGRDTGDGWSEVAPGEVEGPADARRRERSERLLRDSIERAVDGLAVVRGRACRRCGWMNDEDARSCEICRAPSSLAGEDEGSAAVTDLSPTYPGANEPAERGRILELPRSLDAWLDRALSEAKVVAIRAVKGGREKQVEESSRRGARSRGKPATGSGWKCERCGFHNKAKARLCFDCGIAAPEGEA